MPELPEVEAARRLLERSIKRRRIEAVHASRDSIVLPQLSQTRLRASLIGRVVRRVHRRGKHLWIEFDQPPCLLMHLGMSGSIRVRGVAPTRYRSDGKRTLNLDWPPQWMKLRLVFDNGAEIAMTDKRRFGRVRLVSAPLHEPPISELGFDPLLKMLSPGAFSQLLRRRKAPIKAVLLDQSFAAGVGNWIADEVLYQSRIDPRRSAATLSEADARRLRAVLHRVILKAVEVDAVKADFPRNWLFHERWGRNANAVTARGERIEHITVAGRTTAWVPAIQR